MPLQVVTIKRKFKIHGQMANLRSLKLINKVLGGKVFYRLVAVDRNYNASGYSKACVITRLDVILPLNLMLYIHLHVFCVFNH
jgi:disulfide oxidoreductase YuzD